MTKLGELLGWNFEEPHSPKKNTEKPSLDNRLNNNTLEIWESKKGRAGKVVSILTFRKKVSGDDLKELNSLLKIQFSCGGSIKDDSIIIQTSKRLEIKFFIEKKAPSLNIILCGGS